MDIRKKMSTFVLLAMTGVALAGCGGGEDEAPPSQPKQPATCENNFLVFIICTLTSSADPTAEDGQAFGTKADGSLQSAAPVGVDGDTVDLAVTKAFEPNNSLNNANVVYLSTASGSNASGVKISGRLADDEVDYFVFTPVRTGLHSVYVCGDSCAESAVAEDISIMLYDQAQSTVDGTAVSGMNNLEVASELVAGMAYYLEIRGANTGSYELVIVD